MKIHKVDRVSQAEADLELKSAGLSERKIKALNKMSLKIEGMPGYEETDDDGNFTDDGEWLFPS